MSDIILYVVVGSVLGAALSVVLLLFVVWVCRAQRGGKGGHERLLHQLSPSPSSEEEEGRSITSGTSKDLLIYGSGLDKQHHQRELILNSGAPPIGSSKVESVQPRSLSKTESMTSQNSMERKGVASAILEREDCDPVTSFLARRTSSNSIEQAKMGAIRPDLYRKQVAVVKRQSTSSITAVGSIQIRIQYDSGKSDLCVVLLDAKDINPNINEYFFKISLKPGVDTKIRQVPPRKKVNKFAYEEIKFKFPLTFDEVLEQRMILQLYDSGRMGRIPHMIGEVELDLGDLDPSDQTEIWADIESKTQHDRFGELLLSLTYLPSVQRLTVTIHQAKDLKKMDIGGNSDPYVKLVLLQEGKPTKKRNTSVKKSTLEPTWNEAINFNLPPKALPRSSLDVIVKDHDLVGHNETIGKLYLGEDSTENRSRQLWDELQALKSTSATWLTLSPPFQDTKRKTDGK